MARLLFQVSKMFEYHYICIILVLTDPTEMIDIEIDNNERYHGPGPPHYGQDPRPTPRPGHPLPAPLPPI